MRGGAGATIVIRDAVHDAQRRMSDPRLLRMLGGPPYIPRRGEQTPVRSEREHRERHEREQLEMISRLTAKGFTIHVER